MKTGKEFEENIKKHLKELPKGYIESDVTPRLSSATL